MADLMGSYIPDLVLKLDHSDLVELINHFSNAGKGWWGKFVSNPTAEVTALTSMTTLGVLIYNSFLTTRFSNSNRELLEQQARTALENKEIANRKLKLDILDKRWDCVKKYNEYYKVIIIDLLSFIHAEYDILSLETTEKTLIMVLSKDFSIRRRAIKEIVIMENEFYSLMGDETFKKYLNIKSELENFDEQLLDRVRSEYSDSWAEEIRNHQHLLTSILSPVFAANKDLMESLNRHELLGFRNIGS